VWCLLGPAVAGAVLELAVLTGAWAPAVNLLGRNPSGDIGTVIATNGPETAYGALRHGLDPNAVVSVRHRVLTGDRDVRASLLVIATAAGNENTAMVLLSAGTDPALPQNRGAACLADWTGAAALAASIRKGGGEPAVCSPRPADGALALPFVAPEAR
jgi:hypothetical protein